MKTFATILVVSTLISAAAAQPPDTLWTHNYGGPNDDVGRRVIQSSDGGYVVIGSWTVGYYPDVYLIKTNANGNYLWSHTYGGNGSDFGEDVQQTTDGGYIIVGSTNSFGSSGQDVYLIKTNANGIQSWQQTYSLNSVNIGYSVRQTSDGGYIITGETYAGYWDMCLIKTDRNGNLVWQRTFGGSSADVGYSVQQTSDGGYIIAGKTYSISSDFDVYLVKTDVDGNLTWQHTFGGGGADVGRAVQQCPDGGYIIAGSLFAYWNLMQAYLIKTDADGNLTWQQNYGGMELNYGYDLDQTSDGGYVIVGVIGQSQVYLVKTDANGSMVWQKAIGSSIYNEGYGLQQASDGGYILTGCTYVGGYWNIYLVKTTAGGSTPLTIALTPINPPIIIPANGGVFQFNAAVANYGGQNPFYVWARDRNPDGTYTDNLLGPVQINLQIEVVLTRLRSQTVPATWSAGEHYYIGYVDTIVGYPAVEADSFSWTKLTAADGGPSIWSAVCTGETFPGEVGALLAAPTSRAGQALPLPFGIVRVSPNPFNPTTAISYTLQAASHVSLKVYDISGGLMDVLDDDTEEAGIHQVTFDGSRLASGLYFVKLEVSGLGMMPITSVQKMILFK